MKNATVQPPDLTDRENWFLLDVRTPGEFSGQHIEGSLNVPLGDLAQAAATIRERASGKPIAILCRTGQRAEKARTLLQQAGCDPLHVLAGGLEAWQSAGLPLRQGDSGMSLERQVRIAAGSLVVLGTALGLLVHPGWFGLSGFVGAGLVFAGVTNTCGMGMMLAKMPWNRGGASCGVG